MVDFSKELVTRFSLAPTDKNKEESAIAEFQKEYPYGDIEVAEGYVQVICVEDWQGMHCMICNSPLNDRTNYIYRDGEWFPMVRLDHITRWECPKCTPGKGTASIGAYYDTHANVTREEAKRIIAERKTKIIKERTR